MADELVFYTLPMSRGRLARWMLEEVGAPYRTEFLELETTIKSPEFLAINPMGKVPTITHGATVVTEAAAICAYLADAFPDAGLAPPLAQRGAYYRWLFFGAGPYEAAFVNHMLGVEVPPERRGSVGYGDFETVTNVLEYAVSQGEYLAGSDFSAADVYVGGQIGFGLQFETLEARPAFTDYWARISERPARLRGVEIDDAALGGV